MHGNIIGNPVIVLFDSTSNRYKRRHCRPPRRRRVGDSDGFPLIARLVYLGHFCTR
jgi:hypothetical protein